ncbi:LuxR family transcriptional regulator [Reticulibacter mediterranei]|uniref:LuxR family transcriptional regulator n=1 Tax=Reticulibacter mediterranei TaxID=2778369 RepID=A0A8J3IYT2_9CHLR|nr:LuxR C-terminal-related transcriptional regulator [Reticulibacter mediterranei]GHP00986.1 LuxR family transcriptional regulator [Reticulibacter mediterranei]
MPEEENAQHFDPVPHNWYESTSRATPLLLPKLQPPRLRSSLVHRNRLYRLLDGGLERKLTLISAPAGFGKTTLVGQWLSERNTFPVAWLSLDEGDNDPVRFWRYLITACQTMQPDLGRASLGQLLPLQQFSFERPTLDIALATFLNELTTLTTNRLLILEDYHIITSQRIHTTMVQFIDHLPPTLHLIVMTRNAAPLSLARWRTQDELNELDAADLRFSPEEATSFLERAMPIQPTREIVADLTAHTEGWIAGLRLVTLALHGRRTQSEIEQFLTTFGGTQRHILDYLVTEVLMSQPEPLQQFLLQTTMLERLTGPLCDAITGRNDSALVLEQVGRANLFLVPLDETRQWYRYHALFAEAMQHEARRRLGTEQIAACYNKACRWFEQQGMLNEAVEAALAAREFGQAISLIARLLTPQHFTEHQEYYTLRRWFEQIPDDILQTVPDFCFVYAILLQFRPDQLDMQMSPHFEELLQMAQRNWQTENNRPKLGGLFALRAIALWRQGNNSEQALMFARQALQCLPQEDALWRSVCLGIVGGSELQAGQFSTALQTLQEATELCAATENDHAQRATMLMLGDVHAGQGRLHHAAELYRHVHIMAEKDPLDKGKAQQRAATLLYEWNDLETAEREAETALALSRQMADKELESWTLLLLARIHYAAKQPGYEEPLHQLLDWPHKTPRFEGDIRALQTRLQLMDGDLASVRRWLTTRHDDALSAAEQERDALVVARLLIQQGEVEEALRLLIRWQQAAYEAGRLRNVLEIQMLTAQAHFAAKQVQRARQTLKDVLTRAHTEGYQRLFLDEGEAMAALLRVTLPDITDDAICLYVRTLLLAFAQELPAQIVVPVSHPSLPAVLSEPLSPQELRVLRLLAVGRSNPEIARELVVSINTVKVQVKSIYRKLNVTNRVEASQVAHHLRLLA